MAALDPGDQTRIDNLIIAHDAAKAAMLTIIADAGAGVNQSAATVDVLTLTDSLSTFSNEVKIVGNLEVQGGTIKMVRPGMVSSEQIGLEVQHSGDPTRGFKIHANAGSGTFSVGVSLDVIVANNRLNKDIYFVTDYTGTPKIPLILVGSDNTMISEGGIKLGGTAAANLLDDYEEGSFTPEFTAASGSGQTHLVQIGTYTKVGDLVTVNIHVSMTSVGTLSGTVYLSGLPFVSNSGANRFSSAHAGFGALLAITAGTTVSGFIRPGESRIELKIWSAVGGSTNFTAAGMSNDGILMMSATYKV